jgi:hypothetical protein
VKAQYYNMVVMELRNPACRTVLKEVLYVCEMFSPFLHQLQSASPNIHSLQDQCVSLLLSVIGCIVKESDLPTDTKKLIKLDLLKNLRDQPKMSTSTKDCFNKLTRKAQDTVKKELTLLFKTTAEYLQANLHPLDSSLVRHLRVLDPDVRKVSHDGGNASVIESAKQLKRFTENEIDSLSVQWDSLAQTSIPCQKGEIIDVYYDQVLRELEVSQPGTFTESRKFIQLCLSLPTSNAAVERGFSQTKMILESQECLSLQSLIAQRVRKEAIHFYGSSSKVPITPSLLSMQF